MVFVVALQSFLLGSRCCGAPQGQEKFRSLPVEAGELGRPAGSAQQWQDAADHCALSPAAQHAPWGSCLVSCLPLQRRKLRSKLILKKKLYYLLQEDTGLLYTSSVVKNLGDLYDPSFLLPLFSAILGPGSYISRLLLLPIYYACRCFV